MLRIPLSAVIHTSMTGWTKHSWFSHPLANGGSAARTPLEHFLLWGKKGSSLRFEVPRTCLQRLERVYRESSGKKPLWDLISAAHPVMQSLSAHRHQTSQRSRTITPETRGNSTSCLPRQRVRYPRRLCAGANRHAQCAMGCSDVQRLLITP